MFQIKQAVQMTLQLTLPRYAPSLCIWWGEVRMKCKPSADQLKEQTERKEKGEGKRSMQAQCSAVPPYTLKSWKAACKSLHSAYVETKRKKQAQCSSIRSPTQPKKKEGRERKQTDNKCEPLRTAGGREEEKKKARSSSPILSLHCTETEAESKKI